MSLLFAIAPALPLDKAGKFVAGAYIVFVALILIYVAIMAVRAQRLERELDELRRDVEAARAARQAAATGRRRRCCERAAGHRRLAQDRAGRGARAPGAARGARPEFLRDLRGAAEVHEAVAVSTCNRTELYLVVGDPVEAECTVLAMLARQAGIRPTELAGADLLAPQLRRRAPSLPGVSGLESMLVGEAEIQGQVKRAYEAALSRDTTGPLTNRLFRAALATGKRVRTETAIGERQLSLAGGGGGAGPRAAGRPHRPPRW